MIQRLLTIGSSIIILTSASIQDIDRDFKGIVRERGYATEEHTVITQDGYILNLKRIPGQLGDLETNPGPPVLLVHGLIDSSDLWVANDNNSPAFILSRAGYDVWFGNSRGNKYSLGHTSLSTSSEAYWNFSWEEMGQYDLIAFTDYVLDCTGHKKLAYIGHSMGSSQAFYSLTLFNTYF